MEAPTAGRYSPALGRRDTPGTWPTPGPGRPGRNPRPQTATPCRAPCPCAPLCRRRGESGVSHVPSGQRHQPGTRLHGHGTYCCAPRLAPCPRSRTRSPSPMCPRCCPLGSSLGRRRASPCPAWRVLCCGGRDGAVIKQVKLTETTSKGASQAGQHQGLWASTAGLGTRKDAAGRKVRWCFCCSAGQTLTLFHPRGLRSCALI